MEAEHYSRIRPKPPICEDLTPLEALKKFGVQYLEVRTVDINPFLGDGIEVDQIIFLHLFLLYCMMKKSPPLKKEEQHLITTNQNHVALYGRDPKLKLKHYHSSSKLMLQWIEKILNEMQPIADLMDKKYHNCLERVRQNIDCIECTPSAQVLEKLITRKISFRQFGIEQAKWSKKKFQESSIKHLKKYEKAAKESLKKTEMMELFDDFLLKGYEDMELSTQMIIREALHRGVHVEILDRKDNFIKLTKGSKIEYVKQATKTSLDSLISYVVMENKQVTKIILEENYIRVPRGKLYQTVEEAFEAYSEYSDSKIVIKPNFTNYGLGISFVLPNHPEDYEYGIKHAFAHNNEVIVEKWIDGEEFRFLVIADEVCAICKRVAANVVGDGKHTIQQLVRMKNKDPKSYKIPKYHIRLGKVEKYMLQEQELTPQSILVKDKQVFLRNNSNVSTGGDPIDVTDEIDKKYKRIAVKAAQASQATFCGVDMIIGAAGYAIIELNFNPCLHLHRYPFRGRKRYVEKNVLDILGF